MSDDSQAKSSSSGIVLLVLGVLGLVFVVGVAAVAGFAYYQMRSARRAYQTVAVQMAVARENAVNAVEQANPPLGESSRDCAEHFLHILRAGEFADAYEKYTTPKFRQEQTLAQFRQLLGANPGLFGEAEWTGPKENQNAARFTLKLSLDGKAKGTATLELTRENGDWKVDRLSVP